MWTRFSYLWFLFNFLQLALFIMEIRILPLFITYIQFYSIADGRNLKEGVAGNVMKYLNEAAESAMKFIKEGTAHFE